MSPELSSELSRVVDDDFSQFRREWEDVLGRVIARAWAEEDFKGRLLDEPTAILHEEGLVFPDRYVVEFYDDPSAQPGEWHSIGRGSTAIHRFPIPPRPDAGALSAESLGVVDESALACCCPCASCTGAVSHETWN